MADRGGLRRTAADCGGLRRTAADSGGLPRSLLRSAPAVLILTARNNVLPEG
ncbi:hypothetical protein ACWCQK_33845 [Streptomyces sp. NPDC002306]